MPIYLSLSTQYILENCIFGTYVVHVCKDKHVLLLKQESRIMNCVWKSGTQCLKIMKALHHTNKMINMTFDRGGVHIISMDMSKTSLVKLELEDSEFETYECQQTLTLGLYSEVLLNILQKVKKNKLVWSARNEEELVISFVDNQQKTQFAIRTIAIDTDELAIPELQHDVALRVPKDIVRDWFDKMMMTKNDVRFTVSDTHFECHSQSIEFGKITTTEPIGTERIAQMGHRNNVNMTLSFFAIKSMAIFAGTGGDTCFIGLSNKQPSAIKVGLGDDSYLCLYVAPKIEDDD